jgi:hypothetical protein
MCTGLSITAMTAWIVASSPVLVRAVFTNRLLFWGKSRAGQYKYGDIQNAVAHLHGMLEGAHAKR